jgi:hypothetical protein
MTENDVHTMIQSWENLALMVRHISDHPEHLQAIIKMTFDETQPENWRAAWMLDKIHEKHPELVVPYLPELIEFSLQTRNDSKRRHLLKLISLYKIPETQMANLLNYCAEIFTNAAIPVAVRVHAMQILFNIALQEPDFSGELIDMIEHEIEYHGSAGIKSRGSKLLKKLRSTQK